MSDAPSALHEISAAGDPTGEATAASSSGEASVASLPAVVIVDIGDSDDEPVVDEQRSTFRRRPKRRLPPAARPPRPKPKPKLPPGPITLDDSDVEEVDAPSIRMGDPHCPLAPPSISHPPPSPPSCQPPASSACPQRPPPCQWPLRSKKGANVSGHVQPRPSPGPATPCPRPNPSINLDDSDEEAAEATGRAHNPGSDPPPAALWRSLPAVPRHAANGVPASSLSSSSSSAAPPHQPLPSLQTPSESSTQSSSLCGAGADRGGLAAPNGTPCNKRTKLGLSAEVEVFLKQKMLDGCPFKVQPGTRISFGDGCILLSGIPTSVQATASAIKRLMRQLQVEHISIHPMQLAHFQQQSDDVLRRVAQRSGAVVYMSGAEVIVCGEALCTQQAVASLNEALHTCHVQQVALSDAELYAALHLVGPRLQRFRRSFDVQVWLDGQTMCFCGVRDVVEEAKQIFHALLANPSDGAGRLSVVVNGLPGAEAAMRLKVVLPWLQAVDDGWLEIGEKEVLVPFGRESDVLGALNLAEAGGVKVLPNPLNMRGDAERCAVPFEKPVLLLGEGNFSFTIALANALGTGAGIVATTQDSMDQLGHRVGGVAALALLETQLRLLGVKLLFEVDATTLAFGTTSCPVNVVTVAGEKQFRHVVFNFPETGHHDPAIKREANRLLLRPFFHDARAMLQPAGHVHIALRGSDDHRQWELEGLAREAGLELHQVRPFCIGDWPGYVPIHTDWTPMTEDECANAGLFTFAVGTKPSTKR
eukprot:GGOE01017859.1.p1 GENE.GGOE01017859.1~~GGOE01017859.1.p1  ORF type:complete len:760 (-),score=116.95 GGOE01017859.1:224-2503(-)